MFPGLVTNGRRTEYGEREAVRIMSEVRKKGFVEPRRNAEETQTDRTELAKQILSAPVLRELVKIYGTAEAAKRIDHVIGYGAAADPGGRERKRLPVPRGEGAEEPYFRRIRNAIEAKDAEMKQLDLFALN